MFIFSLFPILLECLTDISSSVCPKLNSCSSTPTAEPNLPAAFPEGRYLCLFGSLKYPKSLEQSWAHSRHLIFVDEHVAVALCVSVADHVFLGC